MPAIPSEAQADRTLAMLREGYQYISDRCERYGGAFNFIPHGGGDTARGHRCPGEGITIALMGTAVEMLATAMDYDVPAQDLSVRMSPIPTMPTSWFVITNVRAR